MKAIILAGGFGTRLRSVVSDVPKPLAPIQGRPFLDRLVRFLAHQGIEEVVLSVHHQWEKIEDYFIANPASVPLRYVVEDKPLGTGGAMRFCMEKIAPSEPVLVLNGDTFVKVDLQALMRHHQSGTERHLSMVLRRVEDTGRYGTVETEGGIVTAFGEGRAGVPGLINAGVYVLSSQIFSETLPEAFSFERDFLPPRLGALKPKIFIAEDYFIDIGVPEDYARAQRELVAIMENG